MVDFFLILIKWCSNSARGSELTFKDKLREDE